MVGSMEEGLVMASYIKSSSYRYKVMEFLDTKKVATPKSISAETGILMNHMSFVLRQLKEKGYIECINEHSRKGRLYRLTSTGKLVIDNYLPLL